MEKNLFLDFLNGKEGIFKTSDLGILLKNPKLKDNEDNDIFALKRQYFNYKEECKKGTFYVIDGESSDKQFIFIVDTSNKIIILNDNLLEYWFEEIELVSKFQDYKLFLKSQLDSIIDNYIFKAEEDALLNNWELLSNIAFKNVKEENINRICNGMTAVNLPSFPHISIVGQRGESMFSYLEKYNPNDYFKWSMAIDYLTNIEALKKDIEKDISEYLEDEDLERTIPIYSLTEIACYSRMKNS